MPKQDKEFNALLDEIAQSLGYCLFRLIYDKDGNHIYNDDMMIGTLDDCIKSYESYKKMDIRTCNFLQQEPTFYKDLRIAPIEGMHKNTLRRLVREHLTNLQYKNKPL